jgi:hypothetical protein
MQGTILLNLFDIDPEEENQFFHLFLPAKAFDEVIRDGHWLFARRGFGLLRIWSSTPLKRVEKGTWAHAEWRSLTPRGALVVEIGSTHLGLETWTSWIESAKYLDPSFDTNLPVVSVYHDNHRIRLDQKIAISENLLPPRAKSIVLEIPTSLQKA